MKVGKMMKKRKIIIKSNTKETRMKKVFIAFRMFQIMIPFQLNIKHIAGTVLV